MPKSYLVFSLNCHWFLVFEENYPDLYFENRLNHAFFYLRPTDYSLFVTYYFFCLGNCIFHEQNKGECNREAKKKSKEAANK